MRTFGESTMEALLFSLAGAVGGYILAILLLINRPEYTALAMGLFFFCLIGTLFRGLDRVEDILEEDQEDEPVTSPPAEVPLSQRMRNLGNLPSEVRLIQPRRGLWDYKLPWPEGREILTMYRFANLLQENPSLSIRRWVDKERMFRRYEYERLRNAMERAGLVVKSSHTYQLSKLGMEAVDIQSSPTQAGRA